MEEETATVEMTEEAAVTVTAGETATVESAETALGPRVTAATVTAGETAATATEETVGETAVNVTVVSTPMMNWSGPKTAGGDAGEATLTLTSCRAI